MHLDDIRDIVSRASINEDGEIDSDAFEQICVHFAKEWAIGNINSPYTISFRANKPIDITITEHAHGARMENWKKIAGEPQSQIHFIECKYYGRKLGLEIVSKPYLMALRYRPRSLVIASNAMLTDRALEFGRWLFERETHGTALYYWDPLLGESDDSVLQSAPSAAARADDYAATYSQPPIIESWSLWNVDAFASIPLARSDRPSRKAQVLFSGQKLRFKALLTTSHRRPISACLQLLASGTPVAEIPLHIEVPAPGCISVDVSFDGNVLAAAGSAERVALDVVWNNGHDLLRLESDFPRLEFAAHQPCLEDLRADQVKGVFDKWVKSRHQHVMLIHGEGGVGKTYFCERLCAKAEEIGFQSAYAPVSIETGPGFVTELLWLLLPREMRFEIKSLGDRAFTQDLLQSLAEHYQGERDGEDYRILADLLLNGRWQESETEAILLHIARILVASTKPLILVVGNAHQISDGVAHCLKSLAAAFNEVGWGQVRLILEARDAPEDEGDAWRHLSRWLKGTLAQRIYDVPLCPLDKAEFAQGIGERIVSHDREEAAALICGKSGGNPLYLTNLLQSLIESRLLLPSWSSDGVRYHLSSYPALRDFVAPLGGDVLELLERRIDFWDRQLRADGLALGGHAIGLPSLFEWGISPGLLAALTAEQPEEVERTLLALSRAGLLIPGDDECFIFPHEYVRAAATVWLDANRRSGDIFLQRAANSVLPENYLTTFIKGRIHAYLSRRKQALDAFNAALQHAANFLEALRCHQEIHILIRNDVAGNGARQFHENMRRMLSRGYYILAQEKSIALNAEALEALRRVAAAEMTDGERRALEETYHHNIANLALRLVDLRTYCQNAAVTLETQSPLAASRALNRAVKACALVGATEQGRQLGSLAYHLTATLPAEQDPDLAAVLLGEMSFLYAPIAPATARRLAEMTLCLPSTDRQRAHDLSVAAHALLRDREYGACEVVVTDMEALVNRLALKTMTASADYLRGLLDLVRGHARRAADAFVRCVSDAAWHDLRREEIKFNNNLLVARIAAGDLDAAADVHARLSFLVSRVAPQMDVQPVDAFFHQTLASMAMLVPDGGAWMDCDLFPPTDRPCPNLTTIPLCNLAALYRWQPDRFGNPADHGLHAGERDDRLTATAGNAIAIPIRGMDGGLYAIG